MFVERNQGTQRRGRQRGEHDTVARLVTLKYLALHQNFASSRSQFGTNLFFRLSKRQSLWLREKVGQEDSVVF